VLTTTPNEKVRHAIVAISANESVKERVIRALKDCQWSAQEAEGGAEILACADSAKFDLAVLENKLPDLDANEVLRFLRERNPEMSYLVVDSATGKLDGPHQLTNRRAMILLETLKETEPEWPQRQASIVPTVSPATLPSCAPLPGMISAGGAMAKVHRLARIVAGKNSTVLLEGESGTGKDMVASAIHELSARASAPLVIVNCAAIPESLLESELFGYTRGAFTGAVQARLGRIHAAHRGTLFLDEIGELPLCMQAKLLRFLQAGEVQRLGSTDVFHVDVRVIAATNSHLLEKVAAGQFRQDLYYRLAVFPIHLPPLRERVQDVLPLAEYFLTALCRTHASPLKQLDGAVQFALQEHDWPGNVRELKHVIERAFILSEQQPQITLEHLIFDQLQKKLRKTIPHLA
jgi:transcriptional regulator with PAS, ATPase and Fis domain